MLVARLELHASRHACSVSDARVLPVWSLRQEIPHVPFARWDEEATQPMTVIAHRVKRVGLWDGFPVRCRAGSSGMLARGELTCACKIARQGQGCVPRRVRAENEKRGKPIKSY